MALLSNFAVFKTGTYTHTRKGTLSYVDGDATRGADTVGTVDATIQPATSKDLELLPEGYRVNGVRRIYTETALQVDDQIMIGSDTWRVISLDEHLEFAGSGGGWNRGFIAKEGRS